MGTKVKIIWNGMGGELDSKIVETKDDDQAVSAALIDMVADNIITAGDTFLIEEVE